MPDIDATLDATPATKADDAITARINTYRAAINTGENQPAQAPVYVRTPAMSPDTYRAAMAAGADTSETLTMVGGLAGVCATLGTITTGVQTFQHHFTWGLPIFAAIALVFDTLTVRDTYRLATAQRRYGSVYARLRPPLAAAWRDWHTALDGIRALGDADEAYDALLGNDDRVRAVTLALSNGTLTGEAAEEHRDWLYQTCAKAHRLWEMEHNRKEIAASLTARENLTLPAGDPTALDAALTTSEILTSNARQAITAPARD